jgi:hypothetical protein
MPAVIVSAAHDSPVDSKRVDSRACRSRRAFVERLDVSEERRARRVPHALASLQREGKHRFFAYFLDKLRATPDGDGTLLDHSLVLYGSGMSDGNQHNHTDLPIVLAGGASGRLKGGRHLRHPKNTPMANLLVAMLDTLGIPTDKFGDSNGEVSL